MRPARADALRDGVAGACLLAAGALGWLADTRLPWLVVPTADRGERVVRRAELLSRDPTAYEQALLHWPLAAFVALGVAGAALLALAFWRPAVPSRALRGAVAAAAGAAGLVLLVTSARWAGFALARALDPGMTLARLHAVPGLNAAAGAAALAWAAWEGATWSTRPLAPWREAPAAWRTPLALAWLAAAALVVMPLLPFARLSGASGEFHYDELTLASLGGAGGPAAKVAWALSGVRAALWALLGTAVAALGAAAWAGTPPRDGRASVAAWAPWACAPAAVTLAVFGVAAVRAILGLQAGPTPGPNFVPQAVAVAALLMLTWHGVAARRHRMPPAGPPVR